LKFKYYIVCSYYNKQWQEAQATLVDLLQQEMPPEPPKPERVSIMSVAMIPQSFILSPKSTAVRMTI
jgi:hypothetical protein